MLLVPASSSALTILTLVILLLHQCSPNLIITLGHRVPFGVLKDLIKNRGPYSCHLHILRTFILQQKWAKTSGSKLFSMERFVTHLCKRRACPYKSLDMLSSLLLQSFLSQLTMLAIYKDG